MKRVTKLALAGSLLAGLTASGAVQAEPVKIGMITTLSTGAGYLGEDVRDGFLLAVKEEGGKLGGVEVEIMVEDDGRKPGIGKQLADRFLKQEKAEIITGVIFSNVSPVVAPLTLKAGAFYISPNSAPSTFAGAKCHEDYFAVAWQNDSLHESAGIYATDLGYKNAYILAPNYQAGKDSLAGFKRYFKGDIAGELYTKLGQTDYAAEIAKIRAAKPEMVFHFLPGGMGINFLKQYSQAGLIKEIPLVVSSVSMDSRILKAVGDIALGVRSSSHWTGDMDNAANKKFMAGFVETYGRTPTVFASQGYDTAKLIASALKATGGKVLADKDGFRAALKAANFDSVRGEFKFNTNNHPINQWFGRIVAKGPDGKPMNKTVKMVSNGLADAYASACPLK
ncbi:MAG: ABC transporter substrate-binding protein [Hyphomicrobiales bacterium]|nr:MAG: ABC transporter substrate-binding protein [Hyphomicrobiales bacterium]